MNSVQIHTIKNPITLPTIGTIISYTKIYATRENFPSPLCIGLIELSEPPDGMKRVHCQIIDNKKQKIAIGQHVVITSDENGVMKATI